MGLNIQTSAKYTISSCSGLEELLSRTLAILKCWALCYLTHYIYKNKQQDCLDKFPKFPQREYDKSIDEEIFSYPKIQSLYWLKLESKSSRGLAKILST